MTLPTTTSSSRARSGGFTLLEVLVAVVIFALAYLKFLLNLPPRIRDLFIIAGLTYVSGALLIEAISADQWYLNDGTSLLYSSIGSLEELCEMLGGVVFIYALLLHIEQVQMTVHPATETTLQTSLLSSTRQELNKIRPKVAQVKKAPLLIVFFGGLNLILVQWVLAREMTALLLGTELVVLLVSVSYFAGLSLGYGLAGGVFDRLSGDNG